MGEALICFSFKPTVWKWRNTRIACPYFSSAGVYVNMQFSSFAGAELKECYFADPFILIFVSLHHSLTARLLEQHQAITNLPSLPIPRSIYFFPSHWLPLPAITDCFSHHLSFSSTPPSLPPSGNSWTPSERSTIEHFPTPIILSHPSVAALFFLPLLPIFTTHPALPLHASPSLSISLSLHPAPPKSTTCSGSGRRSSLITNKENPFGAAVCCFSLAPSELSWEEMPHISPLSSSLLLFSPSWISLLTNYFSLFFSFSLSYLFLEPLASSPLYYLQNSSMYLCRLELRI